MLKVATPILYEPALDNFNRVRPLKLAEKSRFSFDYSALCKNPVGTGRPIIGKLAGCNEQGTLLTNTGNSFHNYYRATLDLSVTEPTRIITFTQKVFCVLITYVFSDAVSAFLLKDLQGIITIKNLYGLEPYFYPFKGYSLCFNGDGREDWYLREYIYGFY
jgi:hypothetical protein